MTSETEMFTTYVPEQVCGDVEERPNPGAHWVQLLLGLTTQIEQLLIVVQLAVNYQAI